MRITLLTSFLLSFAALPLSAHEFWLSPESYEVQPGDAIEVRLRVGEKFKGPSYVFIPNRFNRFELVQDGMSVPVDGKMGDDPAMSQSADRPGLVIVVHETQDQTLTYTEWEKFKGFVRHKDFQGALERHKARGLPDTGFKESYRRHAKAMIAVGEGAGADAPVGLATEIVALANPFTDDLSNGLPLLVLAAGEPRAGVQLELFDRAPNGEVAVTLHRTDARGQVSVPVEKGHEYLADAVMLVERDNNDPNEGPVWHSDWAALSFFVPLR